VRQLNTGTNRDKTIALYLRISREDAGKDESYSISNQKKLLTGVARKMRFTKLLVFIDDGITGTSRDRKDFLRMIVELEKGGVGAVMVKDLSRLARETGLSRESLYRTLSGQCSPEFSTILKIIRALNLNFAVTENSSK